MPAPVIVNSESNMQLRRAATLLEVALSMGLLVLLSSMTYWFYASVLETKNTETETARTFRLARVVLGEMANELRHAAAVSVGGVIGIRGGPEEVRLATLRVPERDLLRRRAVLDDEKEGDSDLVVSQYHIARHPDILHEDGYELPLGLARMEFKLPRSDPNSRRAGGGGAPAGGAPESENPLGDLLGGPGEDPVPGEAPESEFDFPETAEEEFGDPDLLPDVNWEELYAPEIKYIRFCYFDGKTWWDDWELSNGNTLPQMVQVTIGFDGCAPFGEEFMSLEEEEFCTCMNEVPSECLPLPPDRYTAVVRIPQADVLFSSRIQKDLNELIKQLSGDGGFESDAEGLR